MERKARSELVQRLYTSLRTVETGEYRSVLAEMRQVLRAGITDGDLIQDITDALIDCANLPVFTVPLVEMKGGK
jgi:hypothetical protein